MKATTYALLRATLHHLWVLVLLALARRLSSSGIAQRSANWISQSIRQIINALAQFLAQQLGHKSLKYLPTVVQLTRLDVVMLSNKCPPFETLSELIDAAELKNRCVLWLKCIGPHRACIRHAGLIAKIAT